MMMMMVASVPGVRRSTGVTNCTLRDGMKLEAAYAPASGLIDLIKTIPFVSSPPELVINSATPHHCGHNYIKRRTWSTNQLNRPLVRGWLVGC